MDVIGQFFYTTASTVALTESCDKTLTFDWLNQLERMDVIGQFFYTTASTVTVTESCDKT